MEAKERSKLDAINKELSLLRGRLNKIIKEREEFTQELISKYQKYEIGDRVIFDLFGKTNNLYSGTIIEIDIEFGEIIPELLIKYKLSLENKKGEFYYIDGVNENEIIKKL